MTTARLRTALLCGLAAVAGLLLNAALYHLVFVYPFHDQSWYLYAAGQVLHGTQLYGPRLTETNPPLILWFSMLPVALGQALHATPLRMLQVVVDVLLVLSSLWTVRLLRVAGMVQGGAATVLAFAATLAVEASTTAVEFGQREQLVVLLLLPYVVAAAVRVRVVAGKGKVSAEAEDVPERLKPRDEGDMYGTAEAVPLQNRTVLAGAEALPYPKGPFDVEALPYPEADTLGVGERVALGLAAAMGVCFKPQHLLVILGLEMFLVLSGQGWRRLVRPEALALVVGGLLYVAVVKLAAPLYLSGTVPLLKDTYWAYGQIPAMRLVGYQVHFNLLVVGVLLVWWWRRPTLLFPGAPLALVVCSVCASVAFYLQKAGWSYQAFPQRAFLYFAAVWLGLEMLRRWMPRMGPQRRFGLLAAVFFALMWPVFLLHGMRELASSNAQKNQTYIQTVMAEYPAGTPVYMLSTSLYGFRYVLEDGLVWSSRYAHLWMLPSIVLNQEMATGGPVPQKVIAMARVEQLAEIQRETLAEDLRTRRPAVILVELCSPTHACQGLAGMPLDTLVWFEQNAAFATEWGHYRRQQGDAEWDVYTRVD